MKILKLLLIFILIIIGFIVGGWIYLNQRSDDIQKILKTELNNSFSGNVSFKSLSISNIRSFPYVAIIINDFYIVEPIKYAGDTIAKFDKVYLEFSVQDFLKKNYEIKSFSIESGKIFIKTYFDGSNSFKYLTSEKKNDNFNLKLDKINISEVHFKFQNSSKNTGLSLFIKKGKTTGKLIPNDIQTNIKSDIIIEYVSFQNIKYFNSKLLDINTHVSFNGNTLKINNCLINLDGIELLSHGTVTNNINNQEFDIAIKGTNIELESFINLFPKIFNKKLKNYSASGYLSINCFIKGNSTKKDNPDIKTFISVKNGLIKHDRSELILSDINLEGLYSNGIYRNSTSSYISLDKISGKINDIDFKGNGKISNLINPEVKLKALSKLPLNTLSNLLSIDNFKGSKGEIKANLSSSFKIKNIKEFKIIDYDQLKLSGEIAIYNADLVIRNNEITNLNGHILLDKSINFSKVSGSLNNNFMIINGKLTNSFSDFFVENSFYNFTGNVYSENINFKDTKFLGVIVPIDTLNAENNFPKNLSIQAKFKFDTLVYDKFNTFKVSGTASYIPKNIKIPDLSFETTSGKYIGNIVIAQNSFNDFFFKSKNQLTNIDINNMFKSFNNFGQTTITYNELSGNLSGNIILSTEFTNDLNLKKDKINCFAEIELTDGKLINFKPAYQLSDYIDIEELKEISFSNLKNIIYIKDQQISFPEMEIYSSAYNIKLAGIHKFDNTFTYNIDILLSEFLSKNARNKNYSGHKGILSEKGRIKIPLLLYGSIDDPQVKFNIKKAASSIKEGLNSEKQEVKTIIEQEFRTPDKNAPIQSTKTNNNSFEINWSEDKKPEEDVNLKKEKKQSSGFEIIWEEFDDTL